MKTLVIHNLHRSGSSSGDDLVFKNEVELLQKNGNEVITYTVCNDEFDDKKTFGKIKLGLGMFWSIKHYKAIKKICREERPNVVHIHTFFPLLSPSILYAIKSEGCSCVATLHDTRFICPCATSLRNGQICNDCVDGKFFRMVKHACFKGSKLQSLYVAMIFKFYRKHKVFQNYIDKYICLNDTQIELLKSIGFDETKIVKKYNFVPDVPYGERVEREPSLPQRYAVYYGRIGEEKGIRELMNIWNELPNVPLVVMGSGPLEKEFSTWAKKRKNVYYLGYTEHEQCLKIVRNADLIVFPSIWYEGCSMVVIESKVFGKPIVATDLGFSKEVIKNEENGFVVPLGNIRDFIRTIEKLWNDPSLGRRIGRSARADYEEYFTPEISYRILMEVYNDIKKDNQDFISSRDRSIVYYYAAWKFVRGLWKRLFMGEVKGRFFVGRRVRITHAKSIKCGIDCKFEDYSEIHGLCKYGLNFGDKVTIGRNTMIRPSSYYGGDYGDGLVMGNNSSIGPDCYIGCSGQITIGNNVMIGPKCSLFAEEHVFENTSIPIKNQGVTNKGIVIEDDCWIGSNCIILDGVTIGHGSVIGAGTLVTKDVNPESVVIDKRNRFTRAR